MRRRLMLIATVSLLRGNVNARFALCNRSSPCRFRVKEISRSVIRFTDAVAEQGI
jgi:hypothetical protein